MRILAWSSVLWKTEKEAADLKPELERWLGELDRVLPGTKTFLASGTWTPPEYNPCPRITIINARVPYTKPFKFGGWDYALCAGQAGFWWAFFQDDWDFLLYTDTTVLINCNLRKHIEDFSASGKMIMAGGWGQLIDDGFAVWTRDAVVEFLHKRKRADLDDSISMIGEREKTAILGHSWYNPWPGKCARCDHPHNKYTESQEDAILKFPIITKPTPRMVRLHLERVKNQSVV